MDDLVPSNARPGNRPAAHGGAVPPTLDFVPFPLEAIDQSIPERFEGLVAAHPESLAVKTGRCELTYEALNRLANRVARALLAVRGTAPEPVALFLEKDALLVAAILGTLKAGKIYVPLAPSYPIARNELILADSRAALIVTDGANLATARRLAGSDRVMVNLDLLDSSLDENNLALPIEPDAHAYIIYTSGTTGRPKGIVEIHRNILHNIRNYCNDNYLCRHDRLMGAGSFAFSGSLKDIFGALLNGAALFPVEIEKVGLNGLAGWLVEHRITIFSAVTSTFRQFARTLTGRAVFPDLRLVRVGSEEVTWKDVELFKTHFPERCVLVNGFGATETGTTRMYVLDRRSTATGSSLPIGYPVEGADVLLLDDQGKRVGSHEAGQIAVRSAYLSPGYWQQPELTRAFFVPDPDGSDRRVYLTGDLGVMSPDGCLTHVGRKDFQLKIRGNRVEMAEIEAILQQAPEVEEAVVAARSELPEDRCLVAYVVLRTGAAPTATPRVLRKYLRERLPDASIPSAFVLLDALPLTPNGKVDRKGLPAPNQDPFSPARKFVPPRTELEEWLVELWEELIGIRPIGILDDFFEMGGHSLLAARLYEGIRESIGTSLPFGALISAPTIEMLAATLAEASGTTSRPLVIALRSGGSRPPFFCIPGAGGHALSLYDLARFGDSEQPFFGLEYPGEAPGEACPTRIEDIARRLLTEVRKIQPEGPYRLGGYSFGGAVAYELAQQLLGLGAEVSHLVLLDTWGKGYPTRLPLLGRIFDHLQKLRTLTLSEKLAYTSQKGASLFRKLGRGRLSIPVMRTAPETASEQAPPQTGTPTSRRSWLDYEPRSYPNRLILLRVEEQPTWVGSRFDDPYLGWKPLAAGGIEVHSIPGSHLTLFDKPHVRILAERLSACLGI
jgi:amino acid adenylation domain-containing protein